jgi:glutathione-regulated potassium-efflux system ancillary protein KefG
LESAILEDFRSDKGYNREQEGMSTGGKMKKILINFAHPAKSKSRINMALKHAVQDLEQITMNDLYAKYPDFNIDVDREQALCEAHDILVIQHPFYWYQAPSIVKEWMDLVLEHGWAYGSKGNALEGKLFLRAITAGGSDASYQAEGSNLFTIQELSAPYRAMANLCKMVWIPPFAVLGIHRGLPDEIVRMHAKNYRRFLIALSQDEIDLEKAKHVKYCSSQLDAIIGRG